MPHPAAAVNRRQLLQGLASGPLLIGAGRAGATTASTLPIWAADVAPLVHRDYQGNLRGAALDVLLQAATRRGWTIKPDLMPVARAVQQVLNNTAPGLALAMPKWAGSEPQVTWVHPLVQVRLSLFGLGPGPDLGAGASALKPQQLHVGTLQGSVLSILATERGFARVTTFNSAANGVRMLMAGRFDVLLASEPVVMNALTQLGMPSDSLHLAAELGWVPCYLVASLATPEAAWRPWRDTLADLQREGVMEQAARRYGAGLLRAPD